MRQYEAKLRIYKLGNMDSRPHTKTLRIDAENKKEAYAKAKDLASAMSSLDGNEVRVSYKDVRFLKTRKVAVLVTFVPRTRIVLEIPEGLNVEDYMERCPDAVDIITDAARRKMLSAPDGYLCVDNMEAEDDTEIPYNSTDENPMAGLLMWDYTEHSPVVMAEYLASKRVPPDTSYEEAFETYVECMKRANGDRFFVMKEDEMQEI